MSTVRIRYNFTESIEWDDVMEQLREHRPDCRWCKWPTDVEGGISCVVAYLSEHDADDGDWGASSEQLREAAALAELLVNNHWLADAKALDFNSPTFLHDLANILGDLMHVDDPTLMRIANDLRFGQGVAA